MGKLFKRTLSLLLTLIIIVPTIANFSVATSTNYKQGDIIEFGYYPQSKVTDSSIVSELEKINKNWISYGYYSGTGNWRDGNMVSSDFMQYADIEYGDSKYRAVYFTDYRPKWTGKKTSSSSSDQNQTGLGLINVVT